MAREELISGGLQLDELLKTLPKKIEKNVMRAALREGGMVMREEARRRAPVGDGFLRRSIRVSTRGQRGSLYASVKAGNKKAFYAHMVEYGTRPHYVEVADIDRGPGRGIGRRGSANRVETLASIRTVNRRVLQIGANFIGPSVHHPGARAQPFMRPTADHSFRAAIKAFDKKLRERMTQEGLNVPAPAPDDPE